MAEKQEQAETVSLTLANGARITCTPELAEVIKARGVNSQAVKSAPAKKAAAKKSTN